ncbi:L-lactate permease [Staphylococcus aureus]
MALFVFELPARVSAGAITEGVVAGIFPIGYIVLMAVWLYKVSTKTGQFLLFKIVLQVFQWTKESNYY